MNYSDKEEMRIVGVFNHKDDYYMLLLSERCNRFYLKIENNTLCNVTLEEYIDINKTYFSPRIVKGNKKIKIEPLIRFKNKLITLSMAASIMFSLAACGKTEALTIEPTEVPNEVVVQEATVDQSVEKISSPEEVEIVETDIEKTIRELKSIGVYVENISPDVDLYRINGVELKEPVYQGIDFTPLASARYYNQVTPGEYGEYIGKKDVTYRDVKIALFKNENVDDETKQILLSGITNMENKNFNIDLSVLYYNMERLNVTYLEPGALGYNIGVFDHISGCMYLDKNINNMDAKKKAEIIRHEALGHGSTRAYNEEQELMVDVMDPYLEIDEQGVVRNAGFLGHFGVEGIADAITSIANDKLLTGGSEAYITEVYELSTLCSSVGLTIEDFANGGVELLINRMKEVGIDNPIQYISTFDNTTEMMMKNFLVQADLTDTFVEYYDELEENNVENLNESSLAYQDYLGTISFDGDDPLVIKINDEDTFAWVNPIEVTNSIEKTNSLGR